MLKKLFTLIVSGLLVSSCAFAIDSVYNRDKGFDVDGWSVQAEDSDFDTEYELVTEIDAFRQLNTPGTIEIKSSSALDKFQTLTIRGVDSDGTVHITDISLDSVTGVTPVSDTTIMFRYIDQVTMDEEATGTVTIQTATHDSFVTSITPGDLNAPMVHHFSGANRVPYVTGWKADIAPDNHGSIIYELRWYPDAKDASGPAADTSGYMVVDIIRASTTGTVNFVAFPQPIKLKADGWISVHGKGTMANQSGYAILQGFDSIQ